jgi:hypothetical protein
MTTTTAAGAHPAVPARLTFHSTVRGEEGPVTMDLHPEDYTVTPAPVAEQPADPLPDRAAVGRALTAAGIGIGRSLTVAPSAVQSGAVVVTVYDPSDAWTRAEVDRVVAALTGAGYTVVRLHPNASAVLVTAAPRRIDVRA